MANDEENTTRNNSKSGVCAAHNLVETVLSENRADMAAMRSMMTEFIQHAAEEHSRIREEILLVAKTAHESAATLRHSPPGMPHPLTRSDDADQRVALTLSRRDFRWLLFFTAAFITLVIGIALVAGREGISIWQSFVETSKGK